MMASSLAPPIFAETEILRLDQLIPSLDWIAVHCRELPLLEQTLPHPDQD
uniref:Uncharacterized protein n=1 Tax=Arundo donax TaxID=35708 RepID=A0A0A9BZU0_ARUDO